ncbi:hypothetical protein Bcep18194_B0537 [Burkholderia lata]|uniref:Uncharacterized protein n=2 Tax=Burkholderia cepacia complex TaxID=87882 RepID=Q39A60_BURL3|nr:hypothetical protein Bcep18194_B0537 [Burkholderia lata]
MLPGGPVPAVYGIGAQTPFRAGGQSWYADRTTFTREGAMAAKEVSKKKYLKILNKRLRAEPDAPAGASFAFYPLGAKAKQATGVASSEPRSKRELAKMAAIQRKAAEEFVVTGA